MNRKWIQIFALGLAIYFASPANAAKVVGDRLVVAINNIPYTQRQVEVYIAIKECLRKIPEGQPVNFVREENWKEALKIFTGDMLIFQEAVRLGSFQSTDQNFDKFESIVRERFRTEGGLKALSARLGIDDLTIAKGLETVIRVSAFRRSKDRQAAIASRDDTDDEDVTTETKGKAVARWFLDLSDRSVERQYQDASRYVLIQPAVQSGG